MDFIKYCDQNRILLAIYLPHSTHTLQPLDVVMFKPLSSACSSQVAGFMKRSQELTFMSKQDLYPMFMVAWEASFKEETILKVFEATGLSPLEPEVILTRFNQPTQSGQSSNSDSSALSASNWQKTESLLCQVVTDRSDPPAQKLSRVFHQISVQKSLLTHKAQGLRQVLNNERLRRQRGKALPLEPAEEYHGGAIFWSPRKVKEAHDRQLQHRLKEEQLQHQKAEAGCLRKEKRQEKLKAVRARRPVRAAAQLMKQGEKACEAANQDLQATARRSQQQLQQDQKTSQRDKRGRLKAAIKTGLKKRVATQPQGGGEASGAAAAPSPSQSQHGQAIKLPAKYR
jgi:hypothetical protein